MYRTMTSPAVAASRRTDVYAFGTMMWEVLTGIRPWYEGPQGGLWSEADRLVAVRSGGTLDFGMLPKDTPAGLRATIESCLALDPSARPTMSAVLAELSQAHGSLVSGHFDVFLSYAWGAGGRRKPLVDALHLCLRDAGLRVWQVRAVRHSGLATRGASQG
jgi:serine/threonine protein kinase